MYIPLKDHTYVATICDRHLVFRPELDQYPSEIGYM